MTYRERGMGLCWTIGLVMLSAGCAVVPKSQLVACQRYNCDLQAKNQQIFAQIDELEQRNWDLADRGVEVDQQMAEQEGLIASLQTRLAEYQQERDDLHASYQAVVGGGAGPLPTDVQFKLEDFARRYPGFVEVDSQAGISKFRSDVLFPSGEAELSAQAKQMLGEFAQIFQDPEAMKLKIMVVGHTDRQRIIKDSTRARHETNWHLSVHRSVAVTRFLQQTGIEPDRMGAVGYASYQPVDLSQTAESLARNRRVEIFVVAPHVPVVGRTDTLPQY